MIAVQPSTPKQPAMAAQLAHLQRLYASLSDRLSPDLARKGATDDLVTQLARPLAQRVTELTTLLSEMEAELEAAAGDPFGSDPFGFDLSFEMTPAPGETSTRQTVTASLTAHAANVCFAARGELGRVSRSLERVGTSYEVLLGACESARRKIRRSIGAVVEAVVHISGDESPLATDHTAEVESAIAIRAMYAKFRRELVNCDEADLHSVNRALRYAAVSIAKMVGSPEFAEVRLTDRSLLLSLQARILRWARGSRGREGVQLFKDICTAADLLSAINLRQELKEHDAQLAAELSALLVGEPNAEDFREALGRSADLRGRDDQLDALVEELRDSPFRDGDWLRLAEVVQRVSAELAQSAAPPFS